jgi:hypothetical protein
MSEAASVIYAISFKFFPEKGPISPNFIAI